MTIDKEKLKALAKAANAVTTDVNITMAVGADPEEVKAVQDYLQQTMPKNVLALLAEIERLEMDSRSLKGSCSKLGAEHAGMSRLYKKANRMQFEARQERDQLKAENEALRKVVAGKVVCDLDLFEDLRDSAASEADEHRQHMAAYRPQRQEVLDWTVKRCDLLLAVAKEASHG